LGNAGATLHLPALAGLPEVKIVGACDLDATRREQAVQSFGVPVFADIETMYQVAAPEVVVIATPPASHADFCVRALQAGAHVICEKPFVSSLNEADRVIAAAKAAGKRVALNHEFREMPIFRALRDNVRPREVVFAQVWQLMDLPPWAEPGWRGQMLTRTLYEAGIHLVDFLMALFGECPVSVSATTSSSGARTGETDAIALVTLEFSRGRLAHVVQNRLCKGETQYFEVRAETALASYRASFGGRARVSAGLHRSTRPQLRLDFGVSGLAWREQGSARALLARNPKDPGMVATRNLLQKSLQAFADGTEPPASAEVGRDVLAVLAACYTSSTRGRRVELTDATLRELADMRLGDLPVPSTPA
jgi:predicted dehydrogenase